MLARGLRRRACRTVGLVAVLLTGSVGLSGCDPQARESNPVGVDGGVGSVLVRGARVAPPQDHRYDVGDSPVVWLTLVNESGEIDELTGVSSPHARGGRIRWDRQCDGEAETVSSLPLAPQGSAPGQGTGTASAAAPAGAYYLELMGLTRQVVAGSSLDVTLTFARSGQLTLEMPVHPVAQPPGTVERCLRPRSVTGTSPS